MKYNLPDLISELERQKNNSRNVVVPSSLLRASASENGTQMVLSVPGAPTSVQEGGVTYDNEKVQYLYLTSWAHKQMAQKTGIPQKYYDKILEKGLGQLLSDNVNAWLPDKDKRLVRILDGQVRAILSDRYRMMDNYDLVYMALEKFKEHHAQILRCDLTETRMYVKAIIPDMEINLGDATRADILHPGLLLANSEVGNGRFKVEPFLWRNICQNGVVFGFESFGKVHLGSRMDIGDIFRDETKALEDQTIWAQVQDVIDATFKEDVVNAWAERLRSTKTIIVPQVQSAIDNIVKTHKLPEGYKKDLLEHFMEEPSKTAYGLVNAVTALARDQSDYDTQIELETLGGKLVEMDEAAWQKNILDTVEA